MAFALRHALASAFAPPRYLAPSPVGVDLSTSAIKVAFLSDTAQGIVLSSFADERLPVGAFADGDFADRGAVVEILSSVAKQHRFKRANASLSEVKSYLFETSVPGETKEEWRTAIEPHLDELIPLPPTEALFDIAPVGKAPDGGTLVVGVGYARRVIEEVLSVFDEAGIVVDSLESEIFANARALFHPNDPSTVMLVDVGRSTTRIAIIAGSIPRFATTIGIGGHALTLAVQKHFGVTEEEARRIKAEKGIVSAAGNEDYTATMFSTVSAIKDEIAMRFQYWQGKASPQGTHQPITKVLLVGGNASLRGLPEYLEGVLRVPVTTGDVFANMVSRNQWLPPLSYAESLAFGTSIGLALRSYAS